MASYFFDSSALVKRYVNEAGTDWVTSLIDPATGHEIFLARISGVEVVSAIKRREGRALHRRRTRKRQYQTFELTLLLSLRCLRLARR